MAESKEIGVGAYKEPEKVQTSLFPRPRMIFIGGKTGTGKSSMGQLLTDALRNMYGVNTVRLAFGDMLKKSAAEAFNIPLDYFYNQKDRQVEVGAFHHNGEVHTPPWTMVSVRKLMQWYGTEWAQTAIGPTVWIDALDKTINDFPIPVGWVVVDDLRFLREAAYAQKFAAYLIRLEPHDKWVPGEHANHPSETELDTYSYWDMKFRPKFEDGALDEVAACILNYLQLFPRCCEFMTLPKHTAQPWVGSCK